MVILLGLIAGALLGRRLAARGVTAADALVGRQVLAYAILIGVCAAGLLIYFAPRLAFMPDFAAVYGERAVLDATRAVAALALGLVVALEWPGRRDGRRLRALIGTGSALGLLAGFLAYRALPLRVDAADSWIHEGVVMQTTPYTCAPAAIATLVRWILHDTTATEAAIVSLARTTREGSTTYDELKAMRRLGLTPRYVRFLTPESLSVASQPALLHVNEPIATGATIRHAVALLQVDGAARTVLLGNPLHGRQVKRFDELRTYWTGEAIYIEVSPRP